MPISRKLFDLADDEDAWMREIHDFLKQHGGGAFSEEELLQHYNVDERTHLKVRNAFRLALQRLVESGTVEMKRFGPLNYYAYSRKR